MPRSLHSPFHIFQVPRKLLPRGGEDFLGLGGSTASVRAETPVPCRAVGPSFARGARPVLGGVCVGGLCQHRSPAAVGHGQAPRAAAVGSPPWPGEQIVGPVWGERMWFWVLVAKMSCF